MRSLKRTLQPTSFATDLLEMSSYDHTFFSILRRIGCCIYIFIHSRPSGSNDTTEVIRKGSIRNKQLNRQRILEHKHTVPPGQYVDEGSSRLTKYGDTTAVFTQRSLSDLTLDQSKVRSDNVCVNTLNRIGKPDR